MSSSTIIGNTFENNNRPWNSSADSNNVTHAIGAPKHADLPWPTPVIAFVLARRPNLAYPVSGNEIRDNKLRAACASGCTGIGYFASRGTGYGAGNSWSAQTTNYYSGNDPFGSNVGSRRCGGNWYAGNSTCTASSSPKPCNADDHQHNPPAGDPYRNDGCSFY